MKPIYTMREFFPVDGYFALIEENGVMICKVFSPNDGKRIIEALTMMKA